MHVTEFGSEVAQLLRRYEDTGGVLEFVLLDAKGDSREGDELHREAADLGLRCVQQRIDDWAESVVREHGGTRDDYFRVIVPTEFTPTGSRISVDGFLGPLFRTDGGFERRHEFGLDEDEMSGFAYAFMEPPHGLNNSKELFLEVKRVVLADLPNDTVVYEWKTDELNYFDDGREWWGTFYWTVQRPGDDSIVAILGSTTD